MALRLVLREHNYLRLNTAGPCRKEKGKKDNYYDASMLIGQMEKLKTARVTRHWVSSTIVVQ